MRTSRLVAAFLFMFPLGGQALTVDAKAMARFDVSYARCESMFPEMRGGRDEAYLGMWRIQAGEKSRAELAAARKSAPYRQERQRAMQESTGGEVDAAKLKAQCQALWGEMQKQRALKAAR